MLLSQLLHKLQAQLRLKLELLQQAHKQVLNRPRVQHKLRKMQPVMPLNPAQHKLQAQLQLKLRLLKQALNKLLVQRKLRKTQAVMPLSQPLLHKLQVQL